MKVLIMMIASSLCLLGADVQINIYEDQQQTSKTPQVKAKKKKKRVYRVRSKRRMKKRVRKQVAKTQSGKKAQKSTVRKKATQPKVVKRTVKVVKEPESIWSNYLENSWSGDFQPGEHGGVGTSLLYDVSAKVTDDITLGADMAISRNFRDDTLVAPSDLEFYGKFNIYKIKQTGTKLGARVYAYLPTSESSRDDSMRGAGKLRVDVSQPLGNYFTLGYSGRFRMNNHKYLTDSDNENTNIESVVDHRGYLNISFTEQLTMVNEIAYKRSMDYDGYTSDKIGFTELLEYSFKDSNFGVYGGVSNTNKINQAEGSETRVSVFERDTASWVLAGFFSF